MPNNASLAIVQDDLAASFVCRFIAAPPLIVTVGQFRADYPAFSNPIDYPESMIAYWLMFAIRMLNVGVWQDLLPMGIELFVAHNMTLETRALAEATNGAPPGLAIGMIANKSVDKVSIGYDTASAAEPDAGHWNLTTYGMRFWRLVQTAGAGPVQLGIGCLGPGYGVFPGSGIGAFTDASAAWPGPWFANAPNPSN